MLKILILFFLQVKLADFLSLQGRGGPSTATHESRAVGNLKVQSSVLTAPLQQRQCSQEQKLSVETVCAGFALELLFSAETVVSILF